MLRYKLRTLLMVLALAPPVLAVVLAPFVSYLEKFPLIRQALLITVLFLIGFAVFWLACGLFWLVLMRAFEKLLGERRH